MAGVRFAHGGGIGALLQIDRSLDYVGERRAGSLQNGSDIAHCPVCLFADIAHLTGVSIAACLAGGEHQIAGADRLVEWSAGQRRMVSMNCALFSCHARSMHRCWTPAPLRFQADRGGV